jgi:hypothetical protein
VSHCPKETARIQITTSACIGAAAAAAAGGGGFLVRWLLHGPVQRASKALRDRLGIVSVITCSHFLLCCYL